VTASVHEAGIDGIESTSDVEGKTDENVCSDIDLGSWLTAVHEDASEVIGDRENGLGVIEGVDAGSDSDSGTTFIHEDASEITGGMESKVSRVIESMVSGMVSGLSSGAEGAGVYRNSEGEGKNEEGS
jgi:hypothetical protein